MDSSCNVAGTPGRGVADTGCGRCIIGKETLMATWEYQQHMRRRACSS